jgi:zinc protease
MRILLSRVSLIVIYLTIYGCQPGEKRPLEWFEKPVTIIERLDLLKGLTQHTLPNGLRILIKQDHRLPIVCTMMWYKTGSINDPEGKSGLSHLLEHMTFIQTGKYSKQTIDLMTRQSGGHRNAFTGEDFTCFYFTSASDKWEQFLDIEADRMVRCKFTPEEFERERRVVINELLRALDSPWRFIDREIRRTVFTTHPYKNIVLGSKSHLEGLKLKDVTNFYRDHYRPDNATLVIVGDVDTHKALDKIDQLFGGIQGSERVTQTPPPEPKQTSQRRVELFTDFNMDRLAIAYRTERIGTECDYVLDVISSILTDGESSRLYRRLVEGARVSTGVKSKNNAMAHDGIFTLQVELMPGAKLKEVEALIHEELEALKTMPVPATELRKAKNKIIANFLFEKESIYCMAKAIGYFDVKIGVKYLNTYLEKINAITPEQIMEISRNYFVPKRRSIIWAHRGEKTGTQSREDLDPDWELDLKEQRVIATGIEFAEQWEVVLRNGLTVIALKKTDLPIVTIKVYVNASYIYEPENKAGLAEITGQLLDDGTTDITGQKLRRTARGIAEAIDYIGGRLRLSSTGVTLQILSHPSYIRFALDLIRDMLLYPAFPRDRVEFVKRVTLAKIRARDDRAITIGYNAFNESVYAGTPLHRPPIGYKHTINSITREDIIAHHKRFFRPDNTIIAVAGDISPLEIINAIRLRFSEWVGRSEPLPVPQPKKQTESKHIKIELNTNLVNIFIGHLGIKRQNPDFYTLQVMDYILGMGPGHIDRLSTRLRRKEGLVYHVYASITSQAGIHPGALLCYAAARPKDKSKVIGAIFEELRRLIDEGVTEQEVRTAKDYLIRSFPFGFEKTSDLATYLISAKRFNLGTDYPRRYPSIIESVTKEDVNRVAKRYLDINKYTLVVVGPAEKEEKD